MFVKRLIIDLFRRSFQTTLSTSASKKLMSYRMEYLRQEISSTKSCAPTEKYKCRVNLSMKPVNTREFAQSFPHFTHFSRCYKAWSGLQKKFKEKLNQQANRPQDTMINKPQDKFEQPEKVPLEMQSAPTTCCCCCCHETCKQETSCRDCHQLKSKPKASRPQPKGKSAFLTFVATSHQWTRRQSQSVNF